MGLYEVLSNRAAVNVLKALAEGEEKRPGYAAACSNLEYRFAGAKEAASLLAAHGLITLDHQQDPIITISLKGKEFIAQLDKLKRVLEQISEMPQSVKVEYRLTPLERQILHYTAKLSKQMQQDFVEVNALANDFEGEVATPILKLGDLNLMQTARKGSTLLVKVTERGRKIVEEFEVEE